MTTPEILGFYRQPGMMTSPGAHAPRFEGLPADLRSIAGAVQGLFIHEHIAGAYGIQLTDERRPEVHLRSNSERLDSIVGRDIRPLSEPRPASERMVANCRHYSLFTVGALRQHGIPARLRCGFGTYFQPGMYVDHWVVECWDATASRWKLADTQIDGVQKPLFAIDFDLFDVPRDRFVVAGDAWTMCRQGHADPAKFGILDMHGLWFIAGNLVRDVAALNNMEMLPWDVWGAMTQPGEPIDAEHLDLFDRLAAMTHTPDENFAELRAAYNTDAIRVPTAVFNAVRGQPEPI